MKFIAHKSGRLDKIVQQRLDISRNQVENFIKSIGVNVDGKLIKKCGYRLNGEEVIDFKIPQSKEGEKKEVDFDIEIIYEDEDILVINKPPHLVVHPAPSVKEATVVDWLKAKGVSLSTLSGEERHGIVHRIDKETSGALVIAKNNEAHLKLSAQLENKSMGRYYLALIDLPLKENIITDLPIARNPKNRLKMAILQGGREAKSAFAKISLSKNGKIELIAAKLFTGRTHQIRVHLSSLSRHILGDDLYGFKSRNDKINRVMLHAYLLYLEHPKSKELLFFKAPLFSDFEKVLKENFETELVYEKISPDSLIALFDFSSKRVSAKTARA